MKYNNGIENFLSHQEEKQTSEEFQRGIYEREDDEEEEDDE